MVHLPGASAGQTTDLIESLKIDYFDAYGQLDRPEARRAAAVTTTAHGGRPVMP